MRAARSPAARRAPQQARRSLTLVLVLALLGLAGAGATARAADAPGAPPVTLAVAPEAAAPGDAVAADATLHNTLGAAATASATTSVPAGLKATSATSVDGWTLEYTTDGGTSWSTEPPADFSEHHRRAQFRTLAASDASGEHPLVPLEPVGVLQVSGGGGRLRRLFHQDKLWLVNHHGRAVDRAEPGGRAARRGVAEVFQPRRRRALRSALSRAKGTFIATTAGTPFGQGSSTLVTPNSSVAFIDQTSGRLYAAVQVHGTSGTTQVGWICGQLATMTSCGFTPAGRRTCRPTSAATASSPTSIRRRRGCLRRARRCSTASASPPAVLPEHRHGHPLPGQRRDRLQRTDEHDHDPIRLHRFGRPDQDDPRPRYVYGVSSVNDRDRVFQCHDLQTGSGCVGTSGSMTLPTPIPVHRTSPPGSHWPCMHRTDHSPPSASSARRCSPTRYGRASAPTVRAPQAGNRPWQPPPEPVGTLRRPDHADSEHRPSRAVVDGLCQSSSATGCTCRGPVTRTAVVGGCDQHHHLLLLRRRRPCPGFVPPSADYATNVVHGGRAVQRARLRVVVGQRGPAAGLPAPPGAWAVDRSRRRNSPSPRSPATANSATPDSPFPACRPV